MANINLAVGCIIILILGMALTNFIIVPAFSPSRSTSDEDLLINDMKGGANETKNGLAFAASTAISLPVKLFKTLIWNFESFWVLELIFNIIKIILILAIADMAWVG